MTRIFDGTMIRHTGNIDVRMIASTEEDLAGGCTYSTSRGFYVLLDRDESGDCLVAWRCETPKPPYSTWGDTGEPDRPHCAGCAHKIGPVTEGIILCPICGSELRVTRQEGITSHEAQLLKHGPIVPSKWKFLTEKIPTRLIPAGHVCKGGDSMFTMTYVDPFRSSIGGVKFGGVGHSVEKRCWFLTDGVYGVKGWKALDPKIDKDDASFPKTNYDAELGWLTGVSGMGFYGVLNTKLDLSAGEPMTDKELSELSRVMSFPEAAEGLRAIRQLDEERRNGPGLGGYRHLFNGTPIPVARNIDDVDIGPATLLTDCIENKLTEYTIFINYKLTTAPDIYQLCFSITDQRLLDWGGARSGMSGTPILQNGKLIGALTASEDTVIYGAGIWTMLNYQYRA